MLREAIQNGSDETLTKTLGTHQRIQRALPRRKESGGFMVAAAPSNAANLLAESEFNRFYIRALARRVLEDGITELIVYRAKNVDKPRPESEALIETSIPPQDLLTDLRLHPDQLPRLAYPRVQTLVSVFACLENKLSIGKGA